MFYPWDGCADIDDQARGNLMNYLEFDEVRPCASTE